MEKVLGYMLSEGDGVEAKPEIISNNKQWLQFRAVLQEGDEENRNKRTYPTKLLEKAIQAPYIQERLKTKTLFGECNHPLDQSIERQMVIDQSRVSHIITEMYFEKNLLKGKLETANTHVGKDMKGLIEQGCRVAFSFRGMAPIKNEGGRAYIADPIKALCWDWVLHPSHAPAYMEGLIESSVFSNAPSQDGDVCIALSESDIRSFLEHESDVLNTAEMLGTDIANATISLENNQVSVRHGKTCAKLFLEAATLRKLDEYMIKLF
jgi:hypothetical protein